MIAIILFLWMLLVVALFAKKLYQITKAKVGEERAAYFSKKIIHILGVGLPALLIPTLSLFNSPILPFAIGMLCLLFFYQRRKTGKLMPWAYSPRAIHEIHICLSGAMVLALGWGLLNNIWIGILPLLFFGWGDAITGIVRNFLFKKKTKHWIGNLAMFILCAPLGYFLGGLGIRGLLAALVATLVEHFDQSNDDVTIIMSSFAILVIFQIL